MRRVPALLTSVVAVALANASLPAAAGGVAPSVLYVTAEVKPSGVFRFETRRRAIEVSEEDVKRGFLDIAAGSLLWMETGRLTPIVVVNFDPETGPFKSVEMRTDTGWLAAGAPGGGLSLDAAHLDALPPSGAVRAHDPAAALAPAISAIREPSSAISAAVSYRFHLNEHAGPGIYLLPLTLDIGL